MARANDFFKAAFLNDPIGAASLNHVIFRMNSVIYDYYKDHFGFLKNSSNPTFVTKYKDVCARDLKIKIKKLKSEGVDIIEIKYVSRLLQSKISKPGKGFDYTESLQSRGIHNKNILELCNCKENIGKAEISTNVI